MRLVFLIFSVGSLLLLVSLPLSPAWARVDTLRAFPELRFANGIMDFGQYMGKNIRYPLQAQQAGTIGTSLVSFVVTPAGELTSVTIINSLDKSIDGEVIRLIRSTGKMWMAADKTEPQDSILLILPVRFTLVDRSGDKDFYVEAVKPDFILTEVVVIGYSPQLMYNIRDDAYQVAELSSAAQAKEYERMLRLVSELIRRNPYSDKLYLQRANIERQLGLTKEACSDYKKIIYFLGRTRFPRHFLQNCP